MKSILKKIGNTLFQFYLIFVLVWIGFALLLDLFFIFLELSGNKKLADEYSKEIMWRIDGTFKNNPNNIWYEKQ